MWLMGNIKINSTQKFSEFFSKYKLYTISQKKQRTPLGSVRVRTPPRGRRGPM